MTTRTTPGGSTYFAVKGICPRGCGPTLFLGDGGYVTCGWHACPEPDAASTRLSSLGSDETGAKPAAPAAVPSDSSLPSRTARHGVAAELIKKIERGIRNDQGLGDTRSEAYSAAHALLALVDELADRLYEATGGDRFRDHLTEGIERFKDVPEAVKVLKVAEEYGEATEAYIGMLGANPRKGITHGPDDVADELADVAITALVAMGSFTIDPIQRLTRRLKHVVERGRPITEESAA